MGIKLSVSPVLEYVERLGGVSGICDLNNEPRWADEEQRQESKFADALSTRLRRMKKAGEYDLFALDAFICEKLKTHPAMIYGDAFFDAVDETLSVDDSGLLAEEIDPLADMLAREAEATRRTEIAA